MKNWPSTNNENDHIRLMSQMPKGTWFVYGWDEPNGCRFALDAFGSNEAKMEKHFLNMAADCDLNIAGTLRGSHLRYCSDHEGSMYFEFGAQGIILTQNSDINQVRQQIESRFKLMPLVVDYEVRIEPVK